MCSGRSKNGCLYITLFLDPLRFRLLALAPSTWMAGSRPGEESGSPCDSGGAGIRRAVPQFRHESLISF
jgi:hypothetical protein